MRIGEISEITGLSVSNIRFYEKKGLIGPNREEGSKYRNYTQADLLLLKNIILYRKMDISVENICSILDKSKDLNDVIGNQLDILKERQKNIQGSIELCEKILGDNKGDNLDVEYYLEYVKEEESKGKIFANINSLVDDISSVTMFDYYFGQIAGWSIFSNNKVYFGIKVLWSLFFLIYPVVLIGQSFVKGIETHMPYAILGLFMLLLYVMSMRKSASHQEY